MVLQADRYNGGYQQQTYSPYQAPTGGYNSYQSATHYPSRPYSGPFKVPTYTSTHGPHHQSGWSRGGGDYYGNGGNHLNGAMPHPVKPSTGGYVNSYYENSHTHENSYNHGSPYRQGYGSPHHQGHGSPHHQGHKAHNNGHGYGHGHESSHHQGHDSTHGYGKTHGFESAITNKINKLNIGPIRYETQSPAIALNYRGLNYNDRLDNEKTTIM